MPNPLVKFNFKFTEERRLSAKILTMLVRDFRRFTQAECEHLLMVSVQNLIVFYPVFQFSLEHFNREHFDSSVVGASDKYFDAEEIDYEEFEQEQKAFVA